MELFQPAPKQNCKRKSAFIIIFSALDCLATLVPFDNIMLLRHHSQGMHAKSVIAEAHFQPPSMALSKELYCHAFSLFLRCPKLVYMSCKGGIPYFMQTEELTKPQRKEFQRLVGKSEVITWLWRSGTPPASMVEHTGWRLQISPFLMAENVLIRTTDDLVDAFARMPIEMSCEIGFTRDTSLDLGRKFHLPVPATIGVMLLKELSREIIDGGRWPSVLTVSIVSRFSFVEAMQRGRGWTVLRVMEIGGSAQSEIEAFVREIMSRESTERVMKEIEKAVGEIKLDNEILDREVAQMLVRPGTTEDAHWTVFNLASSSQSIYYRPPLQLLADHKMEVIHLFRSVNDYRKPLSVNSKFSMQLIGRYPIDKYSVHSKAFLKETVKKCPGLYLKYHADTKEYSAYRLLEVREGDPIIMSIKRRPLVDPLRFTIRIDHGNQTTVPMRFRFSDMADFEVALQVLQPMHGDSWCATLGKSFHFNHKTGYAINVPWTSNCNQDAFALDARHYNALYKLLNDPKLAIDLILFSMKSRQYFVTIYSQKDMLTQHRKAIW